MQTTSDVSPSNSLRAEIREFLGRAFKGHEVGDHDDIFASGFVNSLFAMELIVFVESSYGITIESEDLDLENFRTVAKVAELVEIKRAAAFD